MLDDDFLDDVLADIKSMPKEELAKLIRDYDEEHPDTCEFVAEVHMVIAPQKLDFSDLKELSCVNEGYQQKYDMKDYEIKVKETNLIVDPEHDEEMKIMTDVKVA